MISWIYIIVFCSFLDNLKDVILMSQLKFTFVNLSLVFIQWSRLL